MASVFYTIHTGRWAYKSAPGRFENFDEKLEWEEKVLNSKFEQEIFPEDVVDLPVGEVILACWKRQFATANDVVAALDKYLEAREEKCQSLEV